MELNKFFGTCPNYTVVLNWLLMKVFRLVTYPLLCIAPVLFSGCVSPNQQPRVIHLLKSKDLHERFYPYLREFGADNDPDHVFILTNGVLRISGQHYGY